MFYIFIQNLYFIFKKNLKRYQIYFSPLCACLLYLNQIIYIYTILLNVKYIDICYQYIINQ